MHINNISLGDFSTTNIIVKDDKTISFIDLEAANSGDKDNLAFLKYGTPGYRRPQKRERFEDRFIIDKEGLGLTLLNFYTNANDYINLSEQILHNILNDIQKDYKIPIEFIEVINTLIFHSENANLDNLIQKVKNIKVNDFITSEIKLKFSTDQLITELDKVLDCSTNTMLNVIQTKWGKERLFPTHPMEKAQTLYLGDFGVLLSLKYISPNKNINFLVDQYLKNSISKNNELTPGLFSGLCGVAIGSFLLGYKDIAINTFEKARQKSYIFEECLNLKDGIAGYGLTSIFFYQQLQDEKYRTLAEEIASILIKKAKTKENFIYWINNDCIEYGFAQGISGISFFFIELYKITQNARYLDIAKSTILYLIDSATKEKNALYFNKNSKKEYLSPYLEGSAGIAKTFISYLKVENSVEIQHSLELLLNAYDFKYLKSPSYDYGLAAIGDALIDLYYLEKSPLCLKRLRMVAEGILNYQIKDATNELHFPSAISSHISFDYGTGMSGVIVFLNKLNKVLKDIPKEADLLC